MPTTVNAIRILLYFLQCVNRIIVDYGAPNIQYKNSLSLKARANIRVVGGLNQAKMWVDSHDPRCKQLTCRRLQLILTVFRSPLEAD